MVIRVPGWVWLVLLGLPLAELYLMFRMAGLWGFMPTIFAVIGTGIVGAWVAKTEGLRVWGRIQRDLSQGRLPAEDAINAMLLLIAGLLLLLPGAITDVLGLILLLPPVRYLIRGRIIRRWGAVLTPNPASPKGEAIVVEYSVSDPKNDRISS